MERSFDKLIDDANKFGFASGISSISTLRLQANTYGLIESPIRKGDDLVASLRPLDKKSARQNSLSAKYGTGTQPLHTDGAHMIKPPDYILLTCATTSDVPTNFLKMNWMDIKSEERSAIVNGIFLVENGRGSFFSPMACKGFIRYDPGCMTPCDSRANLAAKTMRAHGQYATSHFWDAPGKFLLIDNHQTFHARDNASNEPGREIERVAFWIKGN